MNEAATLMHVERAQNGNAESMERLLRVLAPDVRHYEAKYYSIDSSSVALAACAEAIRTYDAAKGVALAGWVRVVVTRRLITELKHSRALKHTHLNAAVELDAPTFADNAKTLGESSILADCRDADAMERRLEIGSLSSALRQRLASIELSVYDDLLAFPEDTYCERAERLGIKMKALDNALIRIRGKAHNVAGEIGLEI